jgi:beta-glucosidase
VKLCFAAKRFPLDPTFICDSATTKSVRVSMRKILLASLLCSSVTMTVTPSEGKGIANPSIWPIVKDPVGTNPIIESRIKNLLARMSLEQKVGQVVQADLGSVTPEDVYKYHLGSVLNGGNSAPGGKQWAPAPEWLADADRFYDASVRPHGNLPIIPITWGSDAVHGHNNVTGATLFPHNIGLGAMRNPELMRKIGSATAIEMRVTGLDWTFAPTLAVVRDDRWGRTYESYSENPAVVASYARPLVEGLQGKVGNKDWLKGSHIVATAKHFVGDGGTNGGKDQGDNISSETELRDIQAAGYKPAIEAGIQSIMASYNSWHGEKMHGNKSLLTDVLRGRMNFGGFTVGDWNGHGQVAGCKPTDCAASFNAGLDMFMAPDSWKELYVNTLAQAKDGRITMARLDEAVARILRVKLRAGLFEAGRPSSRPLAGQFEKIGSPEHRAIARQAVRESLVLLKNENAALPLKPGQRVLVAGDGSSSYMKQSGGWTLSWQGTGLPDSDFPGATTIGQALADAGGGNVVISKDGSYGAKPDVAVVVFGEDPYAEFQGDVPDLMFRDKSDNLALLKKYKAEGIKTVAVFLSGRPMWVNSHLNASDAFVAAWLPGSEGGGVADVLFGKFDFKGKLPFSWPKLATQYVLNLGDKTYDPLFAYGYGLSYAKASKLGILSEQSGLAKGADLPVGTWFARGKTAPNLDFFMNVGSSAYKLQPSVGSNTDLLRMFAVDRNRQEDSRRFLWSGKGEGLLALTAGAPIDLSRETNGAVAIEIDYKVDAINGTVTASAYGENLKAANGVELTASFSATAGKGWQTLSIPLSCFAKGGVDMGKVAVPVSIKTAGELDMTVSRIALGTSATGMIKCD